ncbi:MAG: RNA polymerase sigma factor RpoH [Gammaproteobacteria bacterium]|nr:RNA polymerase sigma factor RpoH [Gammaproteobacteria bacterium]
MNTALIPASHRYPVSVSNLSAYIQQVNSFTLLDADEERALATELQEHGSVDAAQQLVMSNLRFVVKIARGYMGYGLQLNDLIQEGNIGLMKAVKHFSPEHNVRLISYAVHWIKAEIHEFVIRNWKIVKIATTKSQRKLFFKLRSSKTRLGWFNHEEVQDVADTLGVKPETVLEMESRLSNYDVAFDAPDDEDDEHAFSPSAYLTDQHADPARQLEADDSQSQHLELMTASLHQLDDRSRNIIQRRWLDENKATLHELADEHQVSAERIRQIEQNAIKKLRVALTA